MQSFFQSIDIFGRSFHPKIGSQTKASNILGPFFSIVFFAMSAYVIWIFGIDSFLNNKPEITEDNEIRIDQRINFNIPITYKVVVDDRYSDNYDINSAKYKEEKTYLQEHLNQLLEVSALYYGDSFIKIPFKSCNITDFDSDNKNPLIEKEFLSYNCINFDISDEYELYRRPDDPISKYIKYSITNCVNQTNDSNLCFSKELQEYYFKRFSFSVKIMYKGFDFNPDKKDNEGLFNKYLELQLSKFLLNPEQLKVMRFFEVEYVRVVTDNGYFQENLTYNTTQRFSNVGYLIEDNIYELNPIDKKYRKVLAQLIIYASKSSKVFERQFIKVPQLLAQVTSCCMVPWLIISIFLSRINASITQELLIHQIFNIDESLINDVSHEQENLNECKITHYYINSKNNFNSSNLQIQNILDESEKNNKQEEKTELQKFEEELKQKKLDAKSEVEKRKSTKLKDSDRKSILGQDSLTNIPNLKKVEQKPKKNKLKIAKMKSMETSEDYTKQHGIKEGDVELGLENKFIGKNDNSKDFNQKKYNINFELIDKVHNKTPTAVSYILDSKKLKKETNFNFSINERTLLNVFDHFCLVYLMCGCFRCGRRGKIQTYYDNVLPIVNSYTDFLNLSNSLLDMEKLKYLLMDEDQVAVFNYRSKIEISNNPLVTSAFNGYYYFTKELNDGVKVEQIKNELLRRDDQKRFNERLTSLYK